MGFVDFFGWLMTIWDVASLRVIEDPSLGLPGLLTSGLIALVAGISTLLGHCAILFINRVRGLRFVAVLIVGGLFLTLLYTIQALILWVVAGPITQHRLHLAEQALIATGLAWMIMQLASRLLGRPAGLLAGKVWTLVTGHPTMLDPKDVLAGTPFVPIGRAAAASTEPRPAR